jgi:hypothetical protein
MKNKRLTLKDVNPKLEKLLSSKAVASKATKPQVETHKASVAHDIKNSYIQNLHMRSSMFTLWLLSWLLFFANKLPFIKPIVTLASLYYGRTTWWKLLIKIRKAFVIFNALIGVYIVFKTTGFSFDNILAGFAGMGHQYVEIFMNFTKRLFHWFVELFDHKIIPNIPTPGSQGGGSTPKGGLWSPLDYKNNINPILNNLTPESSLREWYKTPLNININTVPWYKDLSTWMWIGTIVGATACTLGIGYLGYIYLSAPILNLFGATPNITPPSPEGSLTPINKPIELGDNRSLLSYFSNPL